MEKIDIVNEFNKAYLDMPQKPQIVRYFLSEDVIVFSYYKGEKHPAVLQNKEEFLSMIQKHHDCCTHTEIKNNNIFENEDGTIQGVIESYQKTKGVPYENFEIKNHEYFKVKPLLSEMEKYENQLRTAVYNMKTRVFFKLNNENKISFMHHYCEPEILYWE